MALTDTPWCGSEGDKLYLQSGQFTSTIKTSQDISGIDLIPMGIEWDGTNTPWTSQTNPKLYLQSGQFTSTLKTSEDVELIDNWGAGISSDGNGDTPWGGNGDDKLYLTSGQFTSTLKNSRIISSIDVGARGMTWDGTNIPWTGISADKLYLQSGGFASTLKTSLSVNSIDINPNDIGADGTNTPWVGQESDKLYLQSGQFTSTLKTSEDISGVDSSPSGISINNPDARLGMIHGAIEPATQTLTLALLAPTILAFTSATAVVGSELTLWLSLNAPTISAVSELTEVMPSAIGLTASILAPSIAITVESPVLGLAMALGLKQPTVIVSGGIESIVTNTRNFALSNYSNFAFNSMAKFNGKYVYANSSGIYEAGGANDDAALISAGYKTGAIDMYATEVQRLRDAYLTFRSDGNIQLLAVGDEENTRTYNIVNSKLGLIHERRVKFERGIRDRYFNFGVSNVNGSTFEIKSVKVLSEPIRKRR